MSCYLLLGEDGEAKQARIARIRADMRFTADAEKFDCEILHGHKLDVQTLQKAFLALPAVAPQRLIILREAHELSPAAQEALAAFVAHGPEETVLVIESSAWTAKSAAARKLAEHARPEEFGGGPETNVFDMTRAMTRRRPADALKILAGLLEEGQHPLQIMGGLVWFWGKTGERISVEQFKKGLLALQEADVNIKRSRMKPEYALETLIMKLCRLMG